MIIISGIVASLWIVGAQTFFNIKDNSLLTVGGMMIYFLALYYLRKGED
jgi:energy-converting hydrogenase Eha subunit G